MTTTNSRIYESLNPADGANWKSGVPINGSKIVRSRTLGPNIPQRQNSAEGYYAVPRVNATPPLPRTAPPSVPPRNRHCSEGGEVLHSGSFGSSPNDRGFFFSGRRTPTGISKSPSVHSVSSTHSSLAAVEELSLSDFMTRYSKSLPLRVKVCKGFYGVSDQTAVTTGDMFNLHFVKNTKVVVIELNDPDQGPITFSVPLNSSLRFSPLYDPTNNIKDAKKGFKFDTIGDILAAKTMPRVVRATKAFNGSSGDNSVAENELLAIKNTKSKLTGKQLKVFSLSTNRKKTLNENCAGHFTTNPTLLMLQLCDLTTSTSDVFPYKALVMVGRDGLDTILTDLQGEVVTLKQVHSEQTVIATGFSEDCDDGEEGEVAEMPVDLDIEVEALALEEHEIDQLRQDTGYMHDNFDPYSVCLYMTKPTCRLYEIQCQLYKTTTGVNDYRGIEIVRPPSITKNCKKMSTSSTVSTCSSTTQVYQPLNVQEMEKEKCTDYYVVMTPRSVSQDHSSDTSDHSGESSLTKRSQLSMLEQHNKTIEHKMAKMIEEVTKLKSKTEHLTRRCDSLQAQLRMVSSVGRVRENSESSGVSGCSPPSSMDNRPPAPLPRDVRFRSPTPMEDTEGTYHIIGDHEQSSGSPGRTSIAPDSKVQLSNEQFLSEISHQQVLDLLDAMGMKQYQDKFKQEQVNGEILSECDEELLSSDLGVTSKLHRMRLMKIITGRHSAQCILTGEDPYPKKRSSPIITESASE